jgi:hypothetical protein
MIPQTDGGEAARIDVSSEVRFGSILLKNSEVEQRQKLAYKTALPPQSLQYPKPSLPAWIVQSICLECQCDTRTCIFLWNPISISCARASNCGARGYAAKYPAPLNTFLLMV